MAGGGAAFDVPALLLGRDITRLEPHAMLRLHDRRHGPSFDLGTCLGIGGGARQFWDRPWRRRRVEQAAWDDERRSLQHRRQRRNLTLAIEFLLPSMKALY